MRLFRWRGPLPTWLRCHVVTQTGRLRRASVVCPANQPNRIVRHEQRRPATATAPQRPSCLGAGARELVPLGTGPEATGGQRCVQSRPQKAKTAGFPGRATLCTWGAHEPGRTLERDMGGRGGEAAGSRPRAGFVVRRVCYAQGGSAGRLPARPRPAKLPPRPAGFCVKTCVPHLGPVTT